MHEEDRKTNSWSNTKKWTYGKSKKENQFTKEATEPTRPNLDLAFKEGQTIRINIPSKTGELIILLDE